MNNQCILEKSFGKKTKLTAARYLESMGVFAMFIWLSKAFLLGVILMAFVDLIQQMPRLSAFLMSFPLLTMSTFVLSYVKTGDVSPIAIASRDMLVWIPISLLLLIPFAVGEKFNLGFWVAFGIGTASTLVAVALWFWLGHSTK